MIVLRKILGGTDGQSARKVKHGPELEKALAHLCLESPQATWAALVRTDGVPVSCFPSQPPVGQDRIALMSAAILALGERISKELQSGALHYTLVAGVEGLNLVIILDSHHMLALGLAPNASLDATFESLRVSTIPLLKLLDIVELPV
jgi:predicted regulator of Ras-like GTPase activity (Roadblock/LC7/MglB family)